MDNINNRNIDNESKTAIRRLNQLSQTENCVIALSLDEKRKEEHVLIGELTNVKKYLLGYNSKLLANEKRPLGTLINEMCDKTNIENFIHIQFHMFSCFPNIRKTIFEEDLRVHEKIMKSKNLAERFVAIKLVEERIRQLKDDHLQRIDGIIAWPYLGENYTKDILVKWQMHRGDEKRFRSVFPHGPSYMIDFMMSTQTLYAANGKDIAVYQVVDRSIISLLLWYIHIAFQNNEYYKECRNCGEMFRAKNSHEKLCSDACKKNRRRINKAKFDKRAKETKYELADKRVYMYWYNRLSKIKKDTLVPDNEKEFLRSKFKAFRNEALIKKSLVKSGELEFQQFNEWLLEQEGVADTLMDKYL